MIAQRDHVLQLSLAASDIFHVMTVGEGSQQEVVYQSSDTYYEYDASGRLTAVIQSAVGYDNPSGTATIMVHPRYEYDYDHYGNQIAMRDNIYHLADTQDALGRPTTAAVYDHDGTAGDDARQTSWTYDDFNRQVTRQLPMGETETHHYDEHGLLTHTVTFEAHVIGYEYYTEAGIGGLLKSRKLYKDETTYDNGQSSTFDDVSYEYDGFGRERLITDSSGSYEYGYDDQGRLDWVKSSSTGVLVYEYDAVTGQHTATETYSDTSDTTVNSRTEYGYDLLGRLKTVTQDYRDGADITDEVTAYHYDLLGHLDYTMLPNGVQVDNDYDELGRLVVVSHTQGTDELGRYAYTLRLDGRRVQADEQVWDNAGNLLSDSVTAWTYDALGRVTHEVYDDQMATDADCTTSYEYGLTGNQLEKTVDDGGLSTVVYVYDANDRLLTEESSGAEIYYTVYTYVQQVGRDTYDTTFVTKKEKYDSWQMANLLEGYSYTTNYVGLITGATIERTESDTNIKIQSGYSYLYNHAGMRVCVDQYIQNQSTYAIISDTATKYLIDENNPTGYAQVIEERTEDMLNSTEALKTYTLGLDVIAQCSKFSRWKIETSKVDVQNFENDYWH